MYWKNAMIATSDSSMPYSRMLFFTKPPYVRAAGAASGVLGTIFSSMMLMMLSRASRQALFDDRPHDLLLRGLGRGELADEAALVHHVNPVAHAQQFRHLGRNHQDAFALVGQ